MNQHAHKPHQRRLVSIDPKQLEQLASNPELKSNKIPACFGVSQSQFFRYLTHNASLWAVWVSARTAAGHPVQKNASARKVLSADEISILEAMSELEPDDRTASRIRSGAIANGVAPARFGALFYILEHEKHEIWSTADAVPKFFLRDEDARAQRKEAA